MGYTYLLRLAADYPVDIPIEGRDLTPLDEPPDAEARRVIRPVLEALDKLGLRVTKRHLYDTTTGDEPAPRELETRVCACAVDALQALGVAPRAAHPEYGPATPGWSLISASGYNEEYYDRAAFCPQCGGSLDARPEAIPL